MKISKFVDVPAYSGASLMCSKGQVFRLVDVEGGQVGDFFAWIRGQHEWLSVSQTRSFTNRMQPLPGDFLYSSNGRPMLRFREDTSPGFHDTLYSPCDSAFYERDGVLGHPNCKDNCLSSASEAGIDVGPVPPEPLNIFMKVGPREGPGTPMDILGAESAPGDYIEFEALTDVVLVLTACSVDSIYATNNFNCTSLRMDLMEPEA